MIILDEDEQIWIIFIALSLINIYADELKKKNIDSKNIFVFTVVISTIIYIYITNKNYNKYLKNKTYLNKTRLLGNIFVVVGSFLILYFQVKSPNANNPSIE